ncbi:MAG: c-type cytochrome biogenesis protein CcsB [Thermodesulfobacteriaceae bacterium]|nr:c-type cytochrome biogenesis protein CcsB [Thermodesulfobacteriaceae bacterium]MCX8041834.1 c-type cytochrome biogenesis protein CcsB [Thermodesulfobacteriaceae bacterium]MDW8136280.1 c-type cytochrome biogenesis protein CcsB [Thermodesulfobacterium sp.]
MKKAYPIGLGLLIAFLIYLLGVAIQKEILPENSYIFSIVTFVYLLAGIFYLIYILFKWDRAIFIGSVIGWGGFLGNLLGIIIRWIQTHQTGFGYVPLSNLYESLVFFTVCIVGIYLFWEFKIEKKFMGSLVFILSFLFLAFANLKTDPSIKPLIPALKSNWLIAHVVTCFLGYGAFTVAFVMGVFNLLSETHFSLQKFLPEKEILDSFIYKSILFGFFWLTIGIITGAIWADQAWGSYWSWDPKETWSLITWLIYATAIHLRLTRGWSGKKLSWLSILGFLSVLFTYFGVNFLLSGLHSYAELS